MIITITVASTVNVIYVASGAGAHCTVWRIRIVLIATWARACLAHT